MVDSEQIRFFLQQTKYAKIKVASDQKMINKLT